MDRIDKLNLVIILVLICIIISGLTNISQTFDIHAMNARIITLENKVNK